MNLERLRIFSRRINNFITFVGYKITMLDRRYESFTEKYETWENEYIFREKIQNTLYHEKATNAYSRYSRISRSDTVIASNSRDTESIHAICNDRFSQQFNLYPLDAKITLVKDKTRVCRSVINRLSIRVFRKTFV